MKGLQAVFSLSLLLFAARASDQKDPNSILASLLSKHDRTQMPVSKSPLSVAVYLKVLGLQLDPQKNEMTIQMFLRQKWRDERLRWNSEAIYRSTLDASSWSKGLWFPDLFFRNGKSSYIHTLVQPNIQALIRRDGTVIFVQMLTETFRCALRPGWTFPMDRAVCVVQIESMRHDVSEMEIRWDARTAVTVDELSLAEFSQPTVEANVTTISMSTGAYREMKARLDFGRRWLLPYLLTTYLPTGLLLLTACLAFWVHPDAILARLLLPGLPLAVVCHFCHSRGAQADLLQLWLLFCMSFLFLVLLVTAALHMFWTCVRGKEEDRRRGTKNGLQFAYKITEIVLGRTCMPIIFLLFNAYYWTAHPKESAETYDRD